MTKSGEAIAFGEHLKQIAENKKTQVVFFQDVQAETRYEPRSSAYVKKDGFNLLVHFKDKKQNLVEGSAASRVHFYFESDITGTVSPAFRKMKRQGVNIFEFPHLSSLHARIQSFGVVPARFIIE